MSELVEMMVDLSIEKLKENKFGKKRAKLSEADFRKEHMNLKFSLTDQNLKSTLIAQSSDKLKSAGDIFKSKTQTYKNPRYISAKLKYNIWQKDQGQCTKCNSIHNLQYDHIKPLALGGSTEADNLRLLCFHCNQRQRIKAGLLG